MQRYHKNICFPVKYNDKLFQVNNNFNNMKFKYTTHAYNNFKIRFDYMELLQFLTKIKFDIDDIFEYYIENDNIEKVCYKMEYNEYKDIIIILNSQKSIITLYLNNKGDNHITLKHELYCTA